MDRVDSIAMDLDQGLSTVTSTTASTPQPEFEPPPAYQLENVSNDTDDEDAESEVSESEMLDASPKKPRSKKTDRTKQMQTSKSTFSKQKQEMDREKLADTAKRYSYLLGQTELFRHFINMKKTNDKGFEKMMIEADEALAEKEGGSNADRRHRKTEKQEDEELIKREGRGDGQEAMIFTETPPYVQGQMRDYQVHGLNWMISLYENGINGILADEMGLGKTLQTISFLGYLKFFRNVPGPHLVVVPKSTLDNWKREFAKWVPEFRTFILQGTKEERGKLIQERLLTNDFEICITSYEMCLREKSHLKKFSWQYICIDEAHRIKNENSMLSQIVRVFHSRNRLLITGTPLQNNLHELWALLNFLLPDVFSSSQDFDSWFQSQGGDQDKVVQQLHKVLRPFLLRRVKADVEKSLKPKKEVNVYLGMSDMQRKWYQRLLEKDIDAVNGANKKESKTRLLNIVMQLRKCCNHPYLFDGAEPGPPYTTDEHLIYNAGKMKLLDQLLKKMKAQGSRVLLFSQMSRMLDILEDYCIFRDYGYCRIDGNTAHEDRIASIDEYNKPGSDKFIFLLTTRAGGLGINLTTADIVIIYDSDWNPQVDLQAMDRAHRIGQTKQVYVYRFVTENAIEEKVLEKAAQKLRLDQLVIQQGRMAQAQKGASKDELLGMIQHGAEVIFSSAAADDKKDVTEDDIDLILRRGEEKTSELNKKYSALGIDDLQHFTSESAYEWGGKDYSGNKLGSSIALNWIQPAKRERKGNYSVDSYYRDALRVGAKAESKPKAPRPPSQIKVNDWQFYPPRLLELQQKETNYYRKEVGYKVAARTPEPGVAAEDLEKEREAEQEEIDSAEPLTEAEVEEKQELETQGFSDWTKRDFQAFIRGCEKYGRSDLEQIATECDGKKFEDVKEYSKVFWDHYEQLSNWDHYIQQIERGEQKIEKQAQVQEQLSAKVKGYRQPLLQMKITYNQTKGKNYTEEEDRFLLVSLERFGYGTDDVYDKIRDEIRRHPMFRFDWFLKSRTSLEINRRCNTLIALVTKEATEFEEKEVNAKSSAASNKKRKSDVQENGSNKKKKVTDLVKKAGGSRASSVSSSAAGKKKK